MENRRVKSENSFEAETNGLHANYFLKLNCLLLLLFYFFVFKWLLMLMLLTPESCLWFQLPRVPIAYGLTTYKKVYLDICNGTLQCDFNFVGWYSNHTCQQLPDNNVNSEQPFAWGCRAAIEFWRGRRRREITLKIQWTTWIPLILWFMMLKNPQTYYKNLAVFWNMFGHFSTLYMKA